MRVGKGKRRRTENVQHIDLGVYVFDALSKRREILLDNIYGVDLNSESVEITKFSLFLKVCEKGKKLPDLDNNIKCGNSIIPNLNDKNDLLNNNESIKKLINCRIKLLNTPNDKEKENIEESIKEIKNEINATLNEKLIHYFDNLIEIRPFHWEIEYPEIFFDEYGNFKDDSGFDVVIGNPPYVRQEKIKEIKLYLESNYDVYTGKSDLYSYFFEKGIKI